MTAPADAVAVPSPARSRDPLNSLCCLPRADFQVMSPPRLMPCVRQLALVNPFEYPSKASSSSMSRNLILACSGFVSWLGIW